MNCTNTTYSLGGSALGLLSNGQTTVYAAGDDGTHQATLARNYTDNGDGTVTDNVTGLIWQKCSMGQNNDVTCSGTATAVNSWSNAISYCNGLSLASKTWRLPNRNELQSIIDYTKSNLAIDLAVFPNIPNNSYLSSTTSVGDTTLVFYVYFQTNIYSRASRINDFDGYYVRCASGP